MSDDLEGESQQLEHGDVFTLLPGLAPDSAHAAVVDYPWEFDADNGAGRFEDGDLFHTEPESRLSELLAEIERVVVDGGWVFVFTDDKIMPSFRAQIEDSAKLKRRQTCIWARSMFGMGAYHRVQHYPILTATVGSTDRLIRDRGTIYEAEQVRGAVSVGSTRTAGKPVSLYRQLLMPPVVNIGEHIIEPFAGFAPAFSVARERGLGYWGAEIDETMVEAVKDRTNQSSLTAYGAGRHD